MAVIGDSITEDTPNLHGKVLDDYVSALKVILRKYSIPFLDMMESGGIAPHMPIHKELYMPDMKESPTD